MRNKILGDNIHNEDVAVDSKAIPILVDVQCQLLNAQIAGIPTVVEKLTYNFVVHTSLLVF